LEDAAERCKRRADDSYTAYLAKLPSGKRINLFFYDGPISRAVAFEQLLNSGEELRTRTEERLLDRRDWPAADAHCHRRRNVWSSHRHGDMALAYALDRIEQILPCALPITAEFLEMFPPTHEVQIIENPSWSCAHGVERWRSDCGLQVRPRRLESAMARAVTFRPGLPEDWRRDLFERKAGECCMIPGPRAMTI